MLAGTRASLPDPHPGRWWCLRGDGRIECLLCPRRCKLREGQSGFCTVRRRLGDRMVLTAYGRCSGLCVDPIEKKPLNHFLPGTSVLSFGTVGCNLGCRFCQNWRLSRAEELDPLCEDASPAELAAAALRLGCRSVAFTYNDPVISAEFAIDAARACHEAGLKTVAVTAGYISPEARGEFFGAMDAANVDLKGFSDAFYRRLCFGRLQPVLDTLVYLKKETQVWLEVTTLLVPGENDSPAEIDRASDWFAAHLGRDTPWHFSAFHPDFRMSTTPRTPPETLLWARSVALSKGLRYVYTGNVREPSGASTWCPTCGTLLVERDWFRLGAYALEGGRCASCGTPIAGRFESSPGHWGQSPLPVSMR